MSIAFTAETRISRSTPRVWDSLTDWDKAEHWMPGVEWIKASGPTQTGTSLTFHARGKDRPAEISACEAGRSVTIRSVQGGVTADYTYALHDEGPDETRVTLVAECTAQGFVWKAMAPMIRVAMRKADGGQLDAFKKLVDAS